MYTLTRLTTLVLLCALGFSALAEPTPFRAIYKAKYKGLPVSATGIRELRKMEDGSYMFSSLAKAFFASITEQTRIRINGEDPNVVPIEYQYLRRGIGRKKTTILTFDWDEKTVLNDVDEQPWTMDILEGTQDKLSYQFEMRTDLLSAYRKGEDWPRMTYQVADGGHLKEYTFEVVGEEIVETPIGPFRTIKATRVREDSDRITNFWLAPEYDFMLVRFEQVEDDGDGFTLMLREAEFDGKTVEPTAVAQSL